MVVRLPDGTLKNIPAVEMPDRVDEQLQSWDCAFKDLETSDYVVGQAWARQGSAYLLRRSDPGAHGLPSHGEGRARTQPAIPADLREAD